jgi:iron-sulfur cluster repair protein YtfE (RIC family)
VKRHPSLVPLSHDHHDALVLAQGLIVGSAKSPRSNWPSDRRMQVDRVVEFFKATLQSHFDLEEAYVFPLVLERMQDQAALIAELQHDHKRLRRLIQELERTPSSDLDTRLPALGRLLEVHIRKEERVLFQAIQRNLNPAELDEIGEKLAVHDRVRGDCRLDRVEQRKTG